MGPATQDHLAPAAPRVTKGLHFILTQIPPAERPHPAPGPTLP